MSTGSVGTSGGQAAPAGLATSSTFRKYVSWFALHFETTLDNAESVIKSTPHLLDTFAADVAAECAAIKASLVKDAPAIEADVKEAGTVAELADPSLAPEVTATETIVDTAVTVAETDLGEATTVATTVETVAKTADAAPQT